MTATLWTVPAMWNPTLRGSVEQLTERRHAAYEAELRPLDHCLVRSVRLVARYDSVLR
ncbi:MAG: hypothetical protein ACT4P6_17035 [Gemmatimonadaceae bacterium]